MSTERITLHVDVETVRQWRACLRKIVEPTTLYLPDREAMQDAVIKQNAETAKAVIEEIENALGVSL